MRGLNIWLILSLTCLALLALINLWGLRHKTGYKWYREGLFSIIIVIICLAILLPVFMAPPSSR